MGKKNKAIDICHSMDYETDRCGYATLRGLESMVEDLAVYRPNGGEFLISFEEILPRAKNILTLIKSK